MAKNNLEGIEPIKMPRVIKNVSQGYGYKYASLADIALTGYEIPLMKTGTENDKEYVYWKQGDEWLRGAQIVIPASKGMNEAQLYGSALTYARRYTTLMANCLATDDDVNIEKEVLFDEPTTQDIKKLADKFRELYTNEEQARILNGLQVLSAEDIKYEDLIKYVQYKEQNTKK